MINRERLLRPCVEMDTEGHIGVQWDSVMIDLVFLIICLPKPNDTNFSFLDVIYSFL